MQASRHPPPTPAVPQPPKPKPKSHSPQALVSKFWTKYHSKTPGKVTSIFPQSLYNSLLTDADSPYPKARNAVQRYEDAAKQCRAQVRAAVLECDRTNAKFSDPDFDIEHDFSSHANNCIYGLTRFLVFDSDDDSDSDNEQRNLKKQTRQKVKADHVKTTLDTLRDSGILATDRLELDVDNLRKCLSKSSQDECVRHPPEPGSIHRIPWIFENPQFTVDGFSSSDIKQGSIGNCWWLAGLSTIAHRKDLMKKICVARDEECGIYGFVFYRDGEWISTIVDDNLYLKEKDFGQKAEVYDPTGKKARRYKKEKQTGSEALFYAQCEDPNETWLPLIEKAFAKVHNDYQALSGGWAGTAVEDLTGGVTTVVAGNRVLRKERLWREMLGSDSEDGEFVFGLSASEFGVSYKNGLAMSHAYSLLKATEIEDEKGDKVRLVKIRNPWGAKASNGHGEWNGPWSDGSKEWTSYMMKKLRHEFGDDGTFWMTYTDMLDNFKWLYRTRLFDERWTVAQQWTSVSVSWLTGYLRKKFVFEVQEEGMVVIVLSQLDNRYFKDLAGQYEFVLHFLVKSEDSKVPICQVRPTHQWDNRSVNCEVSLEPGTYEVIPRIVAERRTFVQPVEEVVKTYADANPQKLRQIGLQYDLAHAKGGVVDEDEALQKKREEEKEKRQRKKKKEKRGKQMDDAMKRMEEAVLQMRMELVRQASEKKKKKEKEDGDEDDDPKPEKSADEEAEDNRRQGDSTDGSKPAFPPGGWPEESFKAVPNTTLKRQEMSRLNSPESPREQKQDRGSPVINTRPGPFPPLAPEENRDPIEIESLVQSSKNDSIDTPSTETRDGSDTETSASDSGSDEESELSSSDSDSDEVRRLRNRKKRKPWNAVCVMGLRVYAQHAGVKVRLADQKGDEALTLVTKDGKPAVRPMP